MHRGYIKLWRKIRDNWMWKEPRAFSRAEAWIDLIMEAQHDPQPRELIIKNNRLVCNRGECLKSLDTWASRWGWSKSATRRFLTLLKKCQQIDTQSETITTRIKIINYDTYCPLRNADETQVKRIRNDPETQAALDNNVNNVKNGKKETYTADFLTFWKRFPQASRTRSNRKDSFKQFKSALRVTDLKTLNQALGRWCEHWKNNGYEKGVHRWLEKRMWEDPPEKTKQPWEL